MIEASVAQDDGRTEDREEGHEPRRRESLYEVLAALPFEERIEAIERMADRMGV